MAIRKIQNVTFYAELDENINLPSVMRATHDNGNITYEPVSWYPNTVNTAQAGDFVFVGTISGYVEKVLASVIVNGADENPPSVFPDEIDNFGNQKVDIQTADIPDIDDFQYFKAKYPRSTTEGYQLMQLRQLLADKVILASDINHSRNAIIEIEKYLWTIRDRMDEIEEKINDLEERVKVLEEETVIDGKNIGDGIGMFIEKEDRILKFKTIKGTGGITIDETDENVEINAAPALPPTAGCGVPVYGKSLEVCDGTPQDVDFPMKITNGSLDITKTGSFSFKMVRLRPRGGVGTAVDRTLLISLGEGQEQGLGAGRVLKIQSGFIFEVQDKVGYSHSSYSGFVVESGKLPEFYSGKASRLLPHINQDYKNPNVYDMTSDVYE